MPMRRSGVRIVARWSVLAGVLGCALSASADEPSAVLKTIQGTVSAVNRIGIAVEFARTETASQEMYLPFSPKTKLQGLRDLKELQLGDLVVVEYEEQPIKDEQGQYSKSARKAVGVTFVSAAPPPVPERAGASPVATSEEAAHES